MRNFAKTASALTLCFGLIGCASQKAAAPERPAPPTLRAWDTFEPDSEETRAYIGGQPSVEALEAFRASGGTVVINMRTDGEMARLPYYGTTVEGLGLEYVHVPTSGSEMGASQHELVSAALDGAEGPVLLHCGSGTRAVYMWAGHRAAVGDWSAGEAKSWCSMRRDGDAWEGGELAIDRIVAGE
ncbi:MAG: sulfur transferase domain-containing protein [Planctomycetota bacterium]